MRVRRKSSDAAPLSQVENEEFRRNRQNIGYFLSILRRSLFLRDYSIKHTENSIKENSYRHNSTQATANCWSYSDIGHNSAQA